MATLALDLVPESLFDNDKEFVRIVRIGHVSGIATNPIDAAAFKYDPNVLVKALGTQGMPQLNERHPSVANCYVRRHIFTGVSGDAARVQIIYESPRGGSIPVGIYVVEDDIALHSERSMSLGDGTTILVKYTPSGSSTPKSRIVEYNRLTPMRTKRITAIVYDAPTSAERASVGTVNDKIWGGLGVGFWLCAGLSSSYENTSGTFRYAASFLTRQYRDWKEEGFWIDELTGRPPDAVLNDVNAIKSAFRATYNNTVNNNVNGYCTFGPFGMADFGDIFGNF